jgi:hypothetical protein
MAGAIPPTPPAIDAALGDTMGGVEAEMAFWPVGTACVWALADGSTARVMLWAGWQSTVLYYGSFFVIATSTVWLLLTAVWRSRPRQDSAFTPPVGTPETPD